MPKAIRKNQRYRRIVYFLGLWGLLGWLPGAQAQNPLPEPPPAGTSTTPTTLPAIPPEKPLMATICPKFALLGVPRRLKIYGANLAEIELKSEEDVVFSDYQPEADAMSVMVTIEPTATARAGKRTLLLLDSNKEVAHTFTFYLLKREDKALLQKDLLRCPSMKEEDGGKTAMPGAAKASERP